MVKKDDPDSPTPVKKRKLDSNDGPGVSMAGDAVVTAPVLATITDISFSVPQRKKFIIVVTKAGVATTVPGTNKVEWAVEWQNIKSITLLRVPEKAVRQVNFIIFPHGSEGLDTASSAVDPAVFTVPEDATPKTASGPVLSSGIYDTTTYVSLLTSLFNKHAPHPVSLPSAAEFQSAVPQPSRKGETAFHVKAHRGTKEGYLWFLKEGIVWGFKKPLMFVEFARVGSVSYTSITKRTFNLNINIHQTGEEVEFAMIDQADYTGIDAYVRKNRLNDASMAEMRRAVVYKTNKPKSDEDGDDESGEGGTSVSDLQRALQQAEEEEEGEDYDPDEDLEGDSDESGEDSGDSEGELESDEEDEVNEGELADLKEELGSELEMADVNNNDEDMGGVAKGVLTRRRNK